MRELLVRCLLINLAAIVTSGALVLWYPAESGLTLTSADSTHYIQGGVFLGTVLVSVLDVAIGLYLGYWILHPGGRP